MVEISTKKIWSKFLAHLISIYKYSYTHFFHRSHKKLPQVYSHIPPNIQSTKPSLSLSLSLSLKHKHNLHSKAYHNLTFEIFFFWGLEMAPELVPAAVKPASFSKPVQTMLNRAYVTFLAGNGDYVKGVVGLAKGLRKVKTAYPLVVAVLPDVPQEHRQILESQGCIVREIEPVYPPENQTQFAMAYYVINYSKLRIWEVRT